MATLQSVAVIVSLLLSAISMALHMAKKDKAAAEVDKAEDMVKQAEGAIGAQPPKV